MANRRGFRPPRVPPTTAWGRHLVNARLERDWSLTFAFEQWSDGLGKGQRSRTAYRDIEIGKRDPNPQEAAYLTSQVGAPATELEPEATEAAPMLATALSELAQELRASRLAREAQEERLRALEASVALLNERAAAAPRGQSPLRA